MSKIYNQAPLPFMGQKRKFLKGFKQRLIECPADSIYIDLFGGSGLLSRAVKDVHPTSEVVYNDFDNYRKRIKSISTTNNLLRGIRTIVKGLPKDKRIPEIEKAAILDLIAKESGYVDYITLSSSLLFSMKYVLSYEKLAKETFYNVVRESDYDATGYLDGLTIVSMDYKKLFQQYSGNPSVIFLVDPPYLSTEVGTYTGYWKLKDYLDVLNVLRCGKYFYFTSNKSNIVELCEWMASQSNYHNPFANAITNTTAMQMNYSSSYTDYMIFKNSSM
ncbi:hypothetical protein ABDK00_001720 [Niabella insulamsoli]|uniref:hypothetical protein n=1 Tax=Niabella insulamsoli TaxID=3144874 RepID=UPI0031FC2836